MAKEAGLDLVEVAPNVRPPVCRIIEWSKFKYELSKKSKGQKRKPEETKEMRFGTLIGKGDMEHKLKRVREFLAAGSVVKLTVRTPRRVDIKLSDELMKKLLELLNSDESIAIIQPARREGFLVVATVKGNKKNGKAKDKKNGDEEVQADAEGKISQGEKGVEPSSEQKEKTGAN